MLAFCSPLDLYDRAIIQAVPVSDVACHFKYPSRHQDSPLSLFNVRQLDSNRYLSRRFVPNMNALPLSKIRKCARQGISRPRFAASHNSKCAKQSGADGCVPGKTKCSPARQQQTSYIPRSQIKVSKHNSDTSPNSTPPRLMLAKRATPLQEGVSVYQYLACLLPNAISLDEQALPTWQPKA